MANKLCVLSKIKALNNNNASTRRASYCITNKNSMKHHWPATSYFCD